MLLWNEHAAIYEIRIEKQREIPEAEAEPSSGSERIFNLQSPIANLMA